MQTCETCRFWSETHSSPSESRRGDCSRIYSSGAKRSTKARIHGPAGWLSTDADFSCGEYQEQNND